MFPDAVDLGGLTRFLLGKEVFDGRLEVTVSVAYRPADLVDWPDGKSDRGVTQLMACRPDRAVGIGDGEIDPPARHRPPTTTHPYQRG